MDQSTERRRLLAVPGPDKRAALFLDRDGVVIEDCHHLCDPAQVQLCVGAAALLAAAKQFGWPVVVITNQSGIARGLFDWNDYERVNDRMLEKLGPEAPLAAIYGNGHGPDAPPESWRKPSPTMLIEAAKALNLDLAHSILIGDRLSDLQAGAAAGVALVGHVLTGHGQRERPAVQRWGHELQHASPGLPTSSRRAPKTILLGNLDDFPQRLLLPSTPLPA
jgi:D-glycero-D-manno-heptose 1,7-bisphosphate phosphatase